MMEQKPTAVWSIKSVRTVRCRRRKKASHAKRPIRARFRCCWACHSRWLPAAAAVGSINPDPATSALVAETVMEEEQISEASLTTFHVFDEESGGPRRSDTRPTMISQDACGADLYLPQNPPAVNGPVSQAPPSPRYRPAPPGYKYKRS
jgi:hypothetical protein